MKMRPILLSLTLIVLASILGPWLSPYSLSEVSAARLAPPSFSHWLGTDLHGRDLLTRLLYGGRISLLVGLVGATVSLLVGVTYGLISGYLGGRTDNAMMRFVDILYALPRIILVIVLIAVTVGTQRLMISDWWSGSLSPALSEPKSSPSKSAPSFSPPA